MLRRVVVLILPDPRFHHSCIDPFLHSLNQASKAQDSDHHAGPGATALAPSAASLVLGQIG